VEQPKDHNHPELFQIEWVGLVVLLDNHNHPKRTQPKSCLEQNMFFTTILNFFNGMDLLGCGLV